MVPWWTLIIAVFGGGVLSWFFAQKVYDKGEYALMEAKGYVKRGEDWIKSEAGKLGIHRKTGSGEDTA